MGTRAVLTLAVGKPLYVEMAANLARSFRWWHREGDIKFYLATDRQDVIPADLAALSILKITPGQYGEGFVPKLYLDILAPAEQTLFIDADCLCVGKLDAVFARFAGRPVGVVGGSISEGEWFGDTASVCRHLGVPALPKFNGGVYYLERGTVAAQVYSKAREMVEDYDALGLQRLRGRPNDELLMAMAMAAHGLDALPDDGSILADPFACPGPLSLDVLKGGSRLTNPPAPSPLHRDWYPFESVAPLIVHFLGESHQSYQYRREALRLRFAFRNPLIRILTSAYAAIAIWWPGWFWSEIKPRLRPAFRALFGKRAIRPSERL